MSPFLARPRLRAGLSGRLLTSLLTSLFTGLLSSLLFALPSTSAQAADNTVQVLYAGSLTNLMERSIGPAFEQATGQHFAGYAAGSNKIANELRGKLRRGDVFISASPKVNDSLSGSANGDLVHWYVQFAASPLVLGYNPHSRYAHQLQTQRWDAALQIPGIKIGRTDPKLDPKGALTVAMVEHAQQLYQTPRCCRKKPCWAGCNRANSTPGSFIRRKPATPRSRLFPYRPNWPAKPTIRSPSWGMHAITTAL